MIIGTGIDLVEIARIEHIWQRFGQSFAKRLLSTEELTKLPTDPTLQGRWLAKRWAVKEAASKALGTGFRFGITLPQFATTHDGLGKPILLLSGQAEKIALEKGITQWHVSISDEKTHVVAMVIAC